MFVLGLTGSLAMGKSTTARMFHWLGVPVSDADAIVHRLLGAKGDAVAEVARLFPEARSGDAIDRQALGRMVFGDEEALQRLEAILHPLVRQEHQRFIRRQRVRRSPLVVLDIPLLFETGAEEICDAVAVVTAPAFIQRQRAFRRSGMTEKRFNSILSRQLPDAEKRARAEVLLPTGLGKAWTMRCVKRLVQQIRNSGENK